MRRFTRAAGAFAIGVAIAVSGQIGVAHAGGTKYNWLDCGDGPMTTGRLTDLHPLTYSTGGPTWAIGVTASIAPCRTPGTTDVFAIAAYDKDGRAGGWAARYPTTVSDIFSAYAEVSAKTAAVCLIIKSQHRLDCLAVKWFAGESAPAYPVGTMPPLEAPRLGPSDDAGSTPAQTGGGA